MPQVWYFMRSGESYRFMFGECIILHPERAPKNLGKHVTIYQFIF